MTVEVLVSEEVTEFPYSPVDTIPQNSRSRLFDVIYPVVKCLGTLMIIAGVSAWASCWIFAIAWDDMTLFVVPLAVIFFILMMLAIAVPVVVITPRLIANIRSRLTMGMNSSNQQV